MSIQRRNPIIVCAKGDVSNAWRLKAGIDKLLWTIKFQERNILNHGRKSLEEISSGLDADLLPILGEDLCQQLLDLVEGVDESCNMLPVIFSNPEHHKLVQLVKDQITICLCVLRAILKVIFVESRDAENIVFESKHWVNDTRPFRQCNLACPDEAADKLRRVICSITRSTADLGLAVLDALPNVLDEVDPITKHERMLLRNDREHRYENDRKARQERIEELRQERERQLQEIQSCGNTHRADYWWRCPQDPDSDEAEWVILVEARSM